jgi:phage baseplate assembly protein gpV
MNGVVVGLVTNVNDPEGRGRIKLHFPWLDPKHETDWVRIATLMGGGGRGSFFMPEVNDEALVAFEHGDPRFPYVIGFLWNGADEPPAKHVRERKLETKNGHAIRFLDATPENGSLGALIIEDGHGNRIALSNGQIFISSVAVLQLEAPTIVLKGPGYTRVVAPTPNPI